MSKQYNKVEKRHRRARYMKRRQERAKTKAAEPAAKLQAAPAA